VAITIGNGDLSLGGAVVTDVGGTIYAVFENANTVEVWSDIDTVPNLEDSDTAATIFGGGNIEWVHAAIDGASPNIIHIVCACDSQQTRDVAWAPFNTTTGAIGTWEAIATYAESVPTIFRVLVGIDSGNIPRVLYSQNIKIGGGATDQCYYNTRAGGSWGTPERVNATAAKNVDYSSGAMCMCPNDDVEAFYYHLDNGDPAIRRRNAGWGTETFYTETTAVIGKVTCTTGDVPYRYHTDAAQNIEENNVDTGYNTHATQNKVSAGLVGTKRFVFYIDTSSDVHLITNDGTGWVDEGALQAGTFGNVINEWAYNFEYQSGVINYIYCDGTDVFYDSHELPAVAVPMFAYVMM